MTQADLWSAVAVMRRRSPGPAGRPCVGLAVFRRRKVAKTDVKGRRDRSSGAVTRRRPKPAEGFTLLELIVVILLLSILLGFAIPAFRAGGVAGSKDGAARELLHSIKKLKIAALNRQSIHKLHLDLSGNRMWVTREDKAANQATPSPQSERILAKDIRIAHVRFPDNREVRSGEVVIAFYPQGYSDRAVIRLIDRSRTYTDLVVEAFLPMALIASDDNATVF